MSNPNYNTGNVIAAIASIFCPGLGQLIQGRVLSALFYFISSVLLWLILLGWIPWIMSIVSAARYNPNK